MNGWRGRIDYHIDPEMVSNGAIGRAPYMEHACEIVRADSGFLRAELSEKSSTTVILFLHFNCVDISEHLLAPADVQSNFKLRRLLCQM